MNDAEWFAEHTAYLATPEWAFKRGQVLNRDGYRCQARLHGCNGEANQAHHLNYKHWRNEPLFDLIAVCWVCHEQITDMDRANRAPESRLVKTVQPVWKREPLGSDVLSASAKILAALKDGPRSISEIASNADLTVFTVKVALRRNEVFVQMGDSVDKGTLWGIREVGMDLPV